jgi:prepilin-type processing-associated H-X9-DG protein
VQVQGDQLVVRPDSELTEKVLSSSLRNMARASAQVLAASRLRQFVIAMHNYHTDYQKLPAQAIRGKDGKPLLSWRVALLPYLGEEALYKEFKLDEPWDSEHNKKLLARMPSIFRHPALPDAPQDLTYYQVFYSLKAMKPGAVLLQDGHVTLGQLTVQDGTSNTMVVTDAAATSVPWTKPDDLLFDPAQPLPKFASPTKDGYAHAAFADGSVRSFRVDADPKLLRQLIGRNDGLNADTSEVFK